MVELDAPLERIRREIERLRSLIGDPEDVVDRLG
jgi:hypothetical protein